MQLYRHIYTIMQTHRVTALLLASQAQLQFNTSLCPFLVTIPAVFRSCLHQSLQYLRVLHAVQSFRALAVLRASPACIIPFQELFSSSVPSNVFCIFFCNSLCLLHFLLCLLQNVLFISPCVSPFLSPVPLPHPPASTFFSFLLLPTATVIS